MKHFPGETNNRAYFSFGQYPDLAAQAQPMFTGACASRHRASAAEDMVFTQYSPMPRTSKGKN